MINGGGNYHVLFIPPPPQRTFRFLGTLGFHGRNAQLVE